MATGDLAKFQAAAQDHARMMKKVLDQAREIRTYWDKLGLPGGEVATTPLVNNDLINYATFCSILQDLADNVQVSAGDRRAVIERVASTPIS